MASEDGESFELKGAQTLHFEGNKLHRFKAKGAKVNFRDDTMIRRWCSEQEFSTTKDDFEIGHTTGLDDDDDDDFTVDENQLTVMTLPVEFMRRPSTVSIRMKMDQGTRRARRTPRVIFKNGFRNITFKKIPERSMLCFKDLVTTLVRIFGEDAENSLLIILNSSLP